MVRLAPRPAALLCAGLATRWRYSSVAISGWMRSGHVCAGASRRGVAGRGAVASRKRQHAQQAFSVSLDGKLRCPEPHRAFWTATICPPLLCVSAPGVEQSYRRRVVGLSAEPKTPQSLEFDKNNCKGKHKAVCPSSRPQQCQC